MWNEHQVIISSPFEALAVSVFFFLIKCEFFFSCVKKINDRIDK